MASQKSNIFYSKIIFLHLRRQFRVKRLRYEDGILVNGLRRVCNYNHLTRKLEVY